MAPSQKRKRADDEFDQGPLYGMRQILPVANLPADFAGEPLDGMQYLFTVRRDAQKLPDIKRAPNPYDTYPTAGSSFDYPSSTKPPTSKVSLPSAEWQDIFTCRFRNLRINATQPSTDLQIPTYRHLIPEKMNREAWWAFLAGAPESVWNPPVKAPSRQARQRREKFGNSLDMSGPSVIAAGWELVVPETAPVNLGSGHVTSVQAGISGNNSISDLASIPAEPSISMSNRPRDPTPSLLQYIDHRFALHLLMYFSYWIGQQVDFLEGSSASPRPILDTHARWMFALLLRVDAFCTSDETSTLRALIRGCLSLIRARSLRVKRNDYDSAASTPTPLPQQQQQPVMNSSSNLSGELEGESEETVITDEGENQEIQDDSIWLILCAVAGFWGQRDLWGDAEEAFSKMS